MGLPENEHGDRSRRQAEAAPNAAEWDGTAYHRLGNPQHAWGARVLDRLFGLALRGDETILDAGCGTGRVTADILTRLPGVRVIALDRSQNMLDVARAELGRFGDRVELIAGDLSKLELGRAVDVVFSTATFHWVLDHDSLFASLFEVLHPGGHLIAQCGGGANLARIKERGMRIFQRPDYARFFAGLDPPWYFADDVTTRRRLQAAGFVDVETSLHEAPTVFSGEAEYADFLRAVTFGRQLVHVTDPALVDHFIAELVEAGRGDTPSWSLDYVRLNMSARRP